MFSKNTGMALVVMAGAAITAFGSIGCSIHVQAPIREVAYDYSDYGFYDRNYAPSPNYAPAASYTAAVVRGPVDAAEGASCGSADQHAGAASPAARGYRPAHAETTGVARRHRRPRVHIDSPSGQPTPDKAGAVAAGEPRASGIERY